MANKVKAGSKAATDSKKESAAAVIKSGRKNKVESASASVKSVGASKNKSETLGREKLKSAPKTVVKAGASSNGPLVKAGPGGESRTSAGRRTVPPEAETFSRKAPAGKKTSLKTGVSGTAKAVTGAKAKSSAVESVTGSNTKSQADKTKASAASKGVEKNKVAAKPKVASNLKTEPRVKASAAVKSDGVVKKSRVAAEKIKKVTTTESKRKKSQAGKPTGRELADLVVAAAAEHKPVDPVLLDLSTLSSIADWFFIASADNPRQMTAIAEKILRRAREKGVRPLGHEGLGRGEGHWVLVDLGDVVVHIFNLEARGQYDLEGLWTDAPRYPVKV